MYFRAIMDGGPEMRTHGQVAHKRRAMAHGFLVFMKFEARRKRLRSMIFAVRHERIADTVKRFTYAT